MDTINLNKLSNLFLNKKNYTHLNTIIILISQSGKTTESIVNAELVIQNFPKLKKNLIIVSNKESILSKLASQKNIDLIEIPPKVGGRYSVFSPIGLLPLSLCGINTDKLLVGAQKAIVAGTAASKNYALKSAVISFIKNNQYFNTHNTFIFEPRLEEIGKWVRQLVAESLGKNTNGIMPIFTVGSTDLHSIYQLFLQGPKNVFTCFLKIKNPDFNLKISNKLFFKNLVDDIESKNAFDIYNAIYLGVKRSYKKNKLPYCEYILENTNEENIGFFMQTKMVETMYLGFLMRINAFDQPGVEAYKNETREILKRL